MLSKPARESIESWTRRFYDEGVLAIPHAYQQVELVRSDLAGFLGASPDGLGFFTATSGALSQVALSLPLKPDDEILIWDQEYPSNHYPWRVAAERAGAKLVIASSGPNLETNSKELFKHVTPRTRVVAFSWVQFRTGAITDIKAVTEFAQDRGIFTCADIIQGAGVLPFHFAESGLDAACGGSHKWMCSVPSVGYLCLKPDHIEHFPPRAVGANSFGTSEDPVRADAQPRSTALRFEPGSLPLLDILALGASVRLLRETQISRISQEAEWLARKLMHGLREHGYLINSPHGAHFRGAIVNFTPGPDARYQTLDEVSARLRDERVGHVKRPPGLRLSCHAYNTPEEVDRLLEILAGR